MVILRIRMEGTVMLHISFAIKQDQVRCIYSVMNSWYSLMFAGAWQRVCETRTWRQEASLGNLPIGVFAISGKDPST